ncbi:MAG TPA: hypothetical protein VJX67_03730 [Blastocatellia bacterium]|nr:hypothetical protein [Blastocatellia bacterium]
MSYHWKQIPPVINQVTPVTGSGSGSGSPTGAATSSAKVSKKSPKAEVKAKGPKAGAAASGKNVVAFELVFTSGVTGEKITVRVPGVGAFHDRDQRTSIRDVRALAAGIGDALIAVFE